MEAATLSTPSMTFCIAWAVSAAILDPASAAVKESFIKVLVLVDACALLAARLRISSATTANPLPAARRGLPLRMHSERGCWSEMRFLLWFSEFSVFSGNC